MEERNMAMSEKFRKYPQRAHEMKLAGGVDEYDKMITNKAMMTGYYKRVDEEYKYGPVVIFTIVVVSSAVTKGVEWLRNRHKQHTVLLEEEVREAVEHKNNKHLNKECAQSDFSN